jgi:hypothetical protein
MAELTPQQQVQRLMRRVEKRGLQGMEFYFMDTTDDGRIRIECYDSDGRDNYSHGEYLGRVVFDASHDSPFELG